MSENATLKSANDVFSLVDDLVELMVENLSIQDDLSATIVGHEQTAKAIIQYFAKFVDPSDAR